jgi:hypothetical protein
MSTSADPQSPNGTVGPTRNSEQPTGSATEMLHLDRTECLRLLAATGAGRIVVSVTGWDLRRIGSLGLEPWAPGHKGHWIRIRANTVSGRRIALVADHESA